jgi:hypothetical protein
VILCDNLVKIYKVADLRWLPQGWTARRTRQFIALVGARAVARAPREYPQWFDVPSAGRAVVGH